MIKGGGGVHPVEAAIRSPGLRIVLTPGVPGPYGEAAKGILHVKKLP